MNSTKHPDLKVASWFIPKSETQNRESGSNVGEKLSPI
jgi:hypothetical protein